MSTLRFAGPVASPAVPTVTGLSAPERRSVSEPAATARTQARRRATATSASWATPAWRCSASGLRGRRPRTAVGSDPGRRARPRRRTARDRRRAAGPVGARARLLGFLGVVAVLGRRGHAGAAARGAWPVCGAGTGPDARGPQGACLALRDGWGGRGEPVHPLRLRQPDPQAAGEPAAEPLRAHRSGARDRGPCRRSAPRRGRAAPAPAMSSRSSRSSRSSCSAHSAVPCWQPSTRQETAERQAGRHLGYLLVAVIAVLAVVAGIV